MYDNKAHFYTIHIQFMSGIRSCGQNKKNRWAN